METQLFSMISSTTKKTTASIWIVVVYTFIDT